MMTLRSRRTMWVTTLAVVLATFWPGVAMAQDDGESSQEPPPKARSGYSLPRRDRLHDAVVALP